MSFPSEVRAALRERGVPVASSRHPLGVTVKATSSGGVRLTFRPLFDRFTDELVLDTVAALRVKPWEYTREPHALVVRRGRRTATP